MGYLYLCTYAGGGGGRKRRRVVVMHSNCLYDDDAVAKQRAHSDHEHQQPAWLVAPRVKVETTAASSGRERGRGRDSRRAFLSTTTMFDYEIPLDPHWEFPRDR